MACSMPPKAMMHAAHFPAPFPAAQAVPAAGMLGGSAVQFGRPSSGGISAQLPAQSYQVAPVSSGHGFPSRQPANAPVLSHSSSSNSRPCLHQHVGPQHHAQQHLQSPQLMSHRQASVTQVSSPVLPSRRVSHMHAAGAPPPQAAGRPHRHTQAHPGMQAQPHYINGAVARADQPTPRYYTALGAHASGIRSDKLGSGEQTGPLSSIIHKFEQAMSREAETTRSSSLKELDEVTAAQLASIGDTEVSLNRRGGSGLCSSTTSLHTGGLLSRSATMVSIPLTVRSPRSSQSGVRRQASGPSLKAVAMAAVGGAPGSPRGSGWPSVMRSASVGGLGPFDRRMNRSRSPSVSEPGTPINGEESTIHESREFATPWEQYKNAARRAKLLQHQLALATAEASRAAAVVRSSSVAEEAEVEVPDSGRSVPESARSAGASSSAGSVGSRRLLSGRRLSGSAVVAICPLQQQSLREESERPYGTEWEENAKLSETADSRIDGYLAQVKAC
eukprot:gb/GFBE01009109.1/.p1 GENE.gb/GFBE01009109.1/~~gb/GFBE01009109.1/.p1  ORF type:complete len:502 (+),score=51.16 gb/GFBE01009109.1/:1-1506(+)